MKPLLLPDPDTIVAIATAPGIGGVGIVRLSGPASFAICEQLTGRQLTPRYMTYCTLSDTQGNTLDEAMAVRFEGPNSFTGEDIVELQAHGGPVVLRQIVRACVELGARPAEPGEYTQRAYLNGKMDLTQAEAVADLIASSSEQAARNALRSLNGVFSERINQIAAELLTLRLFVEATLDFPDEEDVDRGAEFGLTERLVGVQKRIAQILSETRSAVRFTEGITVALLGEPNVGKSSLLNALAGEDRAIVTDIPGTTRDLLPVDLVLRGLPIRLVDTAGVRPTTDKVEAEGIRRALDQASRADLILLLVDGIAVERSEMESTERLLDSFLGEISALLPEDQGPSATILARRCLVVVTKADLAPYLVNDDATAQWSPQQTSAKTGLGLAQLEEKILRIVGLGKTDAADTGFTARQRHLDALQDTQAGLQRAAELIEVQDDGGVLLAEELRQAHDALGLIVGKTTPDELLGEIFSNFCIGK